MAARGLRMVATGRDRGRSDRRLQMSLAGIAWMVLLLAGCGGDSPAPSQSTDPAPSLDRSASGGFDSPQAAFDAEKKAQLDEDWGALFDTYTPGTQDQLLVGAAFGAVSIASDAGKADELKGMFQKHGVDESNMPRMPSMTSGADMQAMLGEMKKTQAELAAKIKDKRAFFVEFATFMNNAGLANDQLKAQLEASRKAQAAATLTDVKIVGDTAAGIREFTANGKQVKVPVFFTCIDGSWYLHQPAAVEAQ